MNRLPLVLGTLFLFFNIMALGALANYPTIIAPNKCEFVSVNADGVIVEAGQEATIYAMIKNNSDWPFYLSETSFSTNNSFVTVESLTTNLTVGAGQTGLVKGIVKAKTGSDGKNSQVALQVIGHLQNGQYCDSQSIESVLIPVLIESASTPDVCTLTELIVPGPITYTGGQNVTVNVAFRNDRDVSAVLKAHNNFATVNPQTVGLSANQAGNVSFTVNQFTTTQSFLFLDVEQSGCETKSYVVLLQQNNNAPVVPPIVPNTMLLDLDGNVTLQTTDGTYRVEVNMHNSGNQTVSGFLGLNLPDNWTTQNAQSVFVAAGQTKTVSFTVKPNTTPTTINMGQIVFTPTVGKAQTKEIAFPISTGIVGLAFAFLGGNLFWLGLLLLILLLVLLLGARSSRVRRETLMTTTAADESTPEVMDDEKSTLTTTSSVEVKTMSGEPDSWKSGVHPHLPETHVTTKEAKSLNEDPTPSTDFEAWLDRQVSRLRE